MLTAERPSRIINALLDPRLLSREQNEELRCDLLPRCAVGRILGMELLHRGWVTPFQWESISRGYAEQLYLGAYLLLEPLRRGGMGHVFKARNWHFDKTVALKLMGVGAAHASMTQRFRREIESLAGLAHPNIVMALDADEIEGKLFYVMEFVPSIDLARLTKANGYLSLPLACYSIAQTALALSYAHDQGVIHRDIKPSNLLLVERDHSIKLLDLGLARLQSHRMRPSDELTQVGTFIGTPDYVSPEQIIDPHLVDAATDVYSLGCTLFFLLTGSPLFPRKTIAERLVAHCHEPIPDLSAIRPDLPPWVKKFLARMLDKNPARRMSTAGVLDQLLPFLKHSVYERPLSDASTLTMEPYQDDVAVPESPTEVIEPQRLEMVLQSSDSQSQLALPVQVYPRHQSKWLAISTELLISTILAVLLLAICRWGLFRSWPVVPDSAVDYHQEISRHAGPIDQEHRE